MQHVRRILLLAASMTILLTWLYFCWGLGTVSASSNPIRIYSLSPIISPTATSASTGQSPPSSSIDPAIIAAIIGLAGVIVGAVIAGLFALYQMRRAAQVEQKRQEDQYRHDQEMARLQKELELQYKTKEQEQQHQEQEAEVAQSAMLRAKTLDERVAAYRKALQTDPRIARLQILDMNRPLEVTDIYVHLRVHQETRPGYELDPVLWEADRQPDPNVFLKVHRLRLEQRASTALAPEEAIRTYKRCAIVGDPGAGKSTLLKHLALLSIEQHPGGLPDLPIHIELQAFASSGHRDALEFAAAVWEERYLFPRAEALEYMQAQLRDGHALLLLDALDETLAGTTGEQAEESYLQVSKVITDTATRYPQAPIVVTARKAGYHQRARLAGFTELEVLDFQPEDSKQFVLHWFDCHPDPQKRGNAADLNARLERNTRMQALAANPLLLSLIVIVYEEQLDLPERRAELYKQCVDTLLTKWDASRNIRRLRAFKPEHKRHLLEEVAWHFHLQGQRYFPERDLLDVIAAFLPAVGLEKEQNGQVLDEIVAENGLLKEQAHGWYGILHLTLQEYFVAQYAVEQQRLETLIQRRDHPWWEEVLLLYAGRVADASPLLQQLLGTPGPDSVQEDLFHTDLILAGRCLVAYPTIRQAPLRDEVITRLFRVLSSTPYSLTQEQVASTLAEIGGKTVNAQLVSLLVNEQLDSSVRYSIARALGQLGERSIAPQLVSLLANEQLDSNVRSSIAGALGQSGERSIAPQLVSLLANERLDSSVRLRITWALGQLGERSIVPQLVSLLANEQLDSLVRWSIALALGQLGERSIVPQLVHLLTNQQLDWTVRQWIAEALGQLGERSIVPQLVHLLTNQQLESFVRSSIAGALGQSGERSIAPQLVHLLTNQQLDSFVRSSIAGALGQLGERSIAPQLVSLLVNEQLDSSVRSSIAEALGQLGERSIVPQLVSLLANEQLDSLVRWSIALALGRLGERSIAPQLVHLLANERLDSSVCSSIAEALGQLGERSIVPQLVQLLTNEQQKSSVRYYIAGALGQLGERSIAPQLVHLLANEQLDSLVRYSIAGALETLGADEETVQALASLLFTSDMADTIHRTLWTLSRQLGLRICVIDGPQGKRVEVVKFPSV